jgi:hypothetical protein
MYHALLTTQAWTVHCVVDAPAFLLAFQALYTYVVYTNRGRLLLFTALSSTSIARLWLVPNGVQSGS